MELIIYSLRTVAEAIIEPTYLLMLIVFGVIFYLKIKELNDTTNDHWEVIDTLWVNIITTCNSILAGTMGSIILAILGVSLVITQYRICFITSILLLI